MTNYISVQEAAKKWGRSEDTVRRWCRNGEICVIIKAEKIAGRWRIPSDASCPKAKK